jgi:pheromone shutdown protein TraB
VADIFNSLILRKKHPLLKKLDLRKVPGKKLIREMMAYMKTRYPNIYKVLVVERNYFMARRLKRVMAENPGKKILTVVGAGHEEDILNILKENEGVSYSFSYKIGA